MGWSNIVVVAVVSVIATQLGSCEDYRPAPILRTFTSTAIEQVILDVTSNIEDPVIATLFTDCFPNTLDTTVQHHDSSDTFIITGDIDAMWLRDSTGQVTPYMEYASLDSALQVMLAGVVRRQSKSVAIDVYANSFNYNDNGNGHQDDIRTPAMTGSVFEGKYELDSLANVMHLSYLYWKYTNDTSIFDSDWQASMDLIVQTIRYQQISTLDELGEEQYLFQRETTAPTDSLMLSGRAAPANKCGLSRSHFRPSDDSTTLPYLIPSNAYAVVALRELADILRTGLSNNDKADDAESLAQEIYDAIYSFGLIDTPDGTIFAYEVDGFGSTYFMDDANCPSLLSLPYLGFCSYDDPIYLRTRKAILSKSNPYYFSGTVAAGVGGPHVGLGYIWPMSLIMQALTSTDATEVSQCIDVLKAAALQGSQLNRGQGYGFMHESFWMNDSSRFTRPWFAWANSLFGELILSIVYKTHPIYTFSKASLNL
ncbi:glycoside hydrolase family 125 protein [Pelomyxa schiedti]|nr:glycoside hydrolase family 125 protein [Pelomyxa schiedti]